MPAPIFCISFKNVLLSQLNEKHSHLHSLSKTIQISLIYNYLENPLNYRVHKLLFCQPTLEICLYGPLTQPQLPELEDKCA